MHVHAPSPTMFFATAYLVMMLISESSFAGAFISNAFVLRTSASTTSRSGSFGKTSNASCNIRDLFFSPSSRQRSSILLAEESTASEAAVLPVPITKSSTDVKEFYQTLVSSGRDIEAAPVKSALDKLSQTYTTDARTCTKFSPNYDGDWIMETLPTFPDLLGYNNDGDALYTMGRLTYNMIQPGNVVCSVQKITQHVHKLSSDPASLDAEGSVMIPPFVPKSLREEIEKDPSELRSYRTDVHFTIEEKGIKGILQMDGFTVPNPSEANRYSIWFTGGRIYALNGQDPQKWRDIFGTELGLPPPKSKLKKRERFQLWMAKMMMGATPSDGILEDGSLAYAMKKPIGGHNTAYQQVLYLDDDTRITEGNRGTVVVVSRLALGSKSAEE